ncbi:MAG: tRNA glutamyl-Q(34) synthetase GluQRS [Deltaproteobacteria bacterium]|nr:tRNA glutamyl-Q(34) synthetase GluQRS [Deltaproteobacteria bacterium]
MHVVGRLAPTPSGHLHLGNALAFGAAWLSARSADGRLLLRIEDLDQGRARDPIARAQRDDLQWLGLQWDEEVPPQSTRTYTLEGIPTYRCGCSRAERLAGRCRCRETQGTEGAWRFKTPPGEVTFTDRTHGPRVETPTEDPNLRRPDGGAAYPLAVVLDDLRDGVTEVVRGGDLLGATATQVALYQCLGRRTPTWLHGPLLLGEDGKKLSKSHGSTELRALRARGWEPGRVWELLLPLLGLRGPELDSGAFDPERVARGTFVVDGEGRSVTPHTASRGL